MEILTSTGEVCGRLSDICPTCRMPVDVGLDGTISYPNFELDRDTCGFDWHPGAFR